MKIQFLRAYIMNQPEFTDARMIVGGQEIIIKKTLPKELYEQVEKFYIDETKAFLQEQISAE